MSNKAITTNDLKAVLDVVLPPTPSEYKKLLWTNPNPTSSFAAQTISLDLSDYDEVEIEAKQLASGSIIQLCRVGIGKQTKCLFRDGNANNFYTRTFITSTSSVQFGDAYYNATLTNTDCVPTAIYGIKYEQVLPPAIDALEWKLAGTATNNNTVAMPSDYNEILLWGSYSTLQFSAVVPKQEISATAIFPRSANYYNSTNNESVAFKVTSTEAKIEGWYYNGGNARTSGLTFKLYYR